MELKLKKETAKRLFPESPKWFQDVLKETFGDECFNKREFTDIKTFEDACDELGLNPSSIINSNDLPDDVAYKKLKVIVKAINGGWTPDWSNGDQKKWWPWFNLSSGFGFSDSISATRLRIRSSALAFALSQRLNLPIPQNSLSIYTKSY